MSAATTVRVAKLVGELASLAAGSGIKPDQHTALAYLLLGFKLIAEGGYSDEEIRVIANAALVTVRETVWATSLPSK